MIYLRRGYCGKHPKLWDEQIPYVRHAYNRAVLSSTQSSLFEFFFGYFPKDPLDMVFERDGYSSEQNNRDTTRNFVQQIQMIQ